MDIKRDILTEELIENGLSRNQLNWVEVIQFQKLSGRFIEANAMNFDNRKLQLITKFQNLTSLFDQIEYIIPEDAEEVWINFYSFQRIDTTPLKRLLKLRGHAKYFEIICSSQCLSQDIIELIKSRDLMPSLIKYQSCDYVENIETKLQIEYQNCKTGLFLRFPEYFDRYHPFKIFEQSIFLNKDYIEMFTIRCKKFEFFENNYVPEAFIKKFAIHIPPQCWKTIKEYQGPFSDEFSYYFRKELNITDLVTAPKWTVLNLKQTSLKNLALNQPIGNNLFCTDENQFKKHLRNNVIVFEWIKKFATLVDLNYIWQWCTCSSDLIHLCLREKYFINWKLISQYQSLSLFMVQTWQDYLNWKLIVRYQRFDVKFWTEYAEKLDKNSLWCELCEFQSLSTAFINLFWEKFKNCQLQLIRHQKLSNDQIQKLSETPVKNFWLEIAQSQTLNDMDILWFANNHHDFVKMLCWQPLSKNILEELWDKLQLIPYTQNKLPIPSDLITTKWNKILANRTLATNISKYNNLTDDQLVDLLCLDIDIAKSQQLSESFILRWGQLFRANCLDSIFEYQKLTDKIITEYFLPMRHHRLIAVNKHVSNEQYFKICANFKISKIFAIRKQCDNPDRWRQFLKMEFWRMLARYS